MPLPVEAILELGPLLGPGIAGDLGPFTLYTTRTGRFVAYPRSPPTEPPSDSQRKQRMRFAAAVQGWHDLTGSERQAWTDLLLRTSLCMSGFNAFVALSLNPQPEALESLRQRTGIYVADPPEIPR